MRFVSMPSERSLVALVTIFFLLLPSLTLATTWSQKEVADPFSNAKCKVSAPMSSGSYIYQWPSKLDGVYWPHTTMRWVWHCPKSGYTSFGNDFDQLSGPEHDRIRAFLKSAQTLTLPQGDSANLLLLESIYELRDKDDQFWGWFFRVKANLLEGLAQASRRASMKYLEKTVLSDDATFDKLQSTFVLGRYLIEFGDSKRGKALLKDAKTMEWVDEEGESQVGSDYINGLIKGLEKAD